MPMSRMQVAAVLAAGVLGAGAGACGGRENVEKSNQDQGIPEGTPGVIQDNSSEGLTPTATQQPEVTQPAPSQTP